MAAVINPEVKKKMLPLIAQNFGKLSNRKIAKILGIGKTTVGNWCKELGLIVKKNTVNDDFFKTWTPEMAYILGYIFTDGNVCWNPEKSYRALTITAAEKDKEHLERIRKILESTKCLLYSAKTKSYRLIVNSKIMCKDLVKLGVIPNKSLIVQFPDVPKEFLMHFIRGVIDGDGTVRYNERKRSPYFDIQIASGSEAFLTKMAEIISAEGIPGNARKVKDNLFILQYSCKRGLNLAERIYKNTDLYLNRKFKGYETALKAAGGDMP